MIFKNILLIISLTCLTPNILFGQEESTNVDQELALRKEALQQLRKLTLIEIQEKMSMASYNYNLCAHVPALQEKYKYEGTLLRQVQKEKRKENMRQYKKINKRIEKNEQVSQILFSATKFHLETLAGTKKAVEEEINKVYNESQACLQKLKDKHKILVLSQSQIRLDESPTSSPVSSDVEDDKKEG